MPSNIITDYFKGKKTFLRSFMDTMNIEEVLWIREIAERTGIPRAKVYSLMYRLEKRGIVERAPFVWPESPPESDLWGPCRWKRWRSEVLGRSGGGVVGDKWRFLGIIVTPINELLRLAVLDLGAKEDIVMSSQLGFRVT